MFLLLKFIPHNTELPTPNHFYAGRPVRKFSLTSELMLRPYEKKKKARWEGEELS